MWIAIGVIVTLIIIFTILWVLDPRSDRIHTEVRKVQYWLDKQQGLLDDADIDTLQNSIDEVWGIIRKRQESASVLYGSCCKGDLHDAYEKMHTAFYDIYRNKIVKNASKKEAYSALETVKPHKFNVAQDVYLPKYDVHGVIHALNDDDTYTVCDVVEKCYRVNESEIISKKTEEGK